MRNHPPDRRLDPPEPRDEELRRDKLQAEYEREKERRRKEYEDALEDMRDHLSRALTPEYAENLERRIRNYGDWRAA